MSIETPRQANNLIWILVGAIAISLAAIAALNFRFGGICANEILATVPSPDGTLKAVVFQRDCGATTGFSTQVSALRARQTLPNDGGILFVADCDHGAAPTGPGGGPEVRVSWSSRRGLTVACHKRARVFKENTWLWGVSASYTKFD